MRVKGGRGESIVSYPVCLSILSLLIKKTVGMGVKGGEGKEHCEFFCPYFFPYQKKGLDENEGRGGRGEAL